jgi:hypothetical protein
MTKYKNREIKFRAWDNDDKRLLDVVVLSCNKEFEFKCYCHVGEFNGKPTGKYLKEEGCEIMQFTGLLDKNGKEIFEGDILDTSSGNKYKVIFYKGCFVYTHVLDDDPRMPIYEVASSWWVIGNIYENHELLENKNHEGNS